MYGSIFVVMNEFNIVLNLLLVSSSESWREVTPALQALDARVRALGGKVCRIMSSALTVSVSSPGRCPSFIRSCLILHLDYRMRALQSNVDGPAARCHMLPSIALLILPGMCVQLKLAYVDNVRAARNLL